MRASARLGGGVRLRSQGRPDPPNNAQMGCGRKKEFAHMVSTSGNRLGDEHGVTGSERRPTPPWRARGRQPVGAPHKPEADAVHGRTELGDRRARPAPGDRCQSAHVGLVRPGDGPGQVGFPPFRRTPTATVTRSLSRCRRTSGLEGGGGDAARRHRFHGDRLHRLLGGPSVDGAERRCHHGLGHGRRCSDQGDLVGGLEAGPSASPLLHPRARRWEGRRRATPRTAGWRPSTPTRLADVTPGMAETRPSVAWPGSTTSGRGARAGSNPWDPEVRVRAGAPPLCTTTQPGANARSPARGRRGARDVAGVPSPPEEERRPCPGGPFLGSIPHPYGLCG